MPSFHSSPALRSSLRNSPWFSHPFAAIALLFAIVLATTSAASAAAPKSPSTPQNFAVTARTAYSVTVAWSPAPANSGEFTYQLSGAYGVTPVVLPKTATSHTFTGLYPANDYWFFIYARNSAGKVSGQATVSTRTLSDTTAPWTAPVVSATEVGSNYLKLAWTAAQDDGPYQFYEVWVNGSLSFKTGKNIRTAVLRPLAPATTYAIQVRAYDYGNNRSPFSAPLTVTTLPANPNDTVPPTAPTNLTAETFGDGSNETHLRWTQSTDNVDAPANIQYNVYVNGILQDTLFGSGGPSIIYGEFGTNTIQVIAMDTAGNFSAPATITVTF